MRDIQADVREFMTVFKQKMHDRPRWPDQATMDLRVRLKAEEFCEWLRDSGYRCRVSIARHASSPFVFLCDTYNGEKGGYDYTELPRSLPKSADALIDDLYVTVGALLAMGIDMWPLWEAVHAANMAKAGGPIVNGKVAKPEGWTAPDIEALLREQGWSE